MRARLALRAAAFVALLFAGCPSLFAAHDPESEVRRRLAEAGREGLRLPIAGRPLMLVGLELSEIAVRSAPLQAMFHVVTTGKYGEATLGYYGSESLRLPNPDNFALRLPRLEGVLAALTARQSALAHRDLAALLALSSPGLDAGAIDEALRAASPDDLDGAADDLSIRIDGDRAEVSVTRGGFRHALSLVRIGDSWRFSSGLL